MNDYGHRSAYFAARAVLVDTCQRRQFIRVSMWLLLGTPHTLTRMNWRR